MDATNALAEREIRPAMTVRKLSACNRTEAGAETHAVLASLLRTCHRRGHDVVRMLCGLLGHRPDSIAEMAPPAPASA